MSWLRRAVLGGILAVVAITPFYRGLFFPKEQLIAALFLIPMWLLAWECARWLSYEVDGSRIEVERPGSAKLAKGKKPSRKKKVFKKSQQGWLYKSLVWLGLFPAPSSQAPQPFLKGYLDWSLFGVTLAYALSLISAVYLRAAIAELILYSAYFAVYWGLSRLLRSTVEQRIAVFVAFSTTVAVAFLGLSVATGIMSYKGAYEGGRISSSIQYPNSLAAYVLAGFMLGIGLWTSVSGRMRFLKSALYGVMCFLLVLTFMFTYSRAAWIVSVPVGLVILFGMPRGLKLRCLLSIAGTAGITLLVASPFSASLANNVKLVAWKEIGIGAILAVLLGAVLEFMFTKGIKVKSKVIASCIIVVVLVLGAALMPGTRGAEAKDIDVSAVGQGPAGFGGYLVALVDKLLPESVANRLKTISFEDYSLLNRVRWSLDALKIVADYPIIGAGGGGWEQTYLKYQSYIYWSTEVHNHFAQLWVETGTIGFTFFVGSWVAFLVTAWGVIKRKAGPEGAMYAGVATSAIGLGLHSFLDFNLSLGAIALFLWACFGIVRAGELSSSVEGKQIQVQAIPSRDKPVKGSSFKKSSRQDSKSYSKGMNSKNSYGMYLSGLEQFLNMAAWPRWAIYGIAVFLFLGVLFLLIGYNYGQEGAKLLNQGNFKAAREKYESALKYDPLTSTFEMDLALALEALSEGNKEQVDLAISHGRRAVKLNPTNPTIQSNFGRMALRNGRIAEGLKALRDAVEVNPFQIVHYENLARAYLESAKALLKLDSPDAHASAVSYLGRVPEVLEMLQQAARRQSSVANYRLPESTLPLQITLGESYALLGRFDEAETLLRGAVEQFGNNPSVARGEAMAWLAFVYDKKGLDNESRELIEEAEKLLPEARDIVSGAKEMEKKVSEVLKSAPNILPKVRVPEPGSFR